MKLCSKCKVEKPFKEFTKHPLGKDGLRSNCKSCCKQYYEANKEKYNEYNKQHYEANREKRAEWGKQYREANKEKIAERMVEYNKQRYKANKEKRNEWSKQYIKQRLKTDPIYKFKHNVRCLILGSFKRGKNQFQKNTKTEQILDCTIEEFRLYIQSKFKKGMSFDNHGEWHLDHIIPLAVATTEKEIIKLNHYTNFQPLWSEENLSKSDKIIN